MQVNGTGSEGEGTTGTQSGATDAAGGKPAGAKGGDLGQALKEARAKNKALMAEVARLRGAQPGAPQKLDASTLPKGEEFVAEPESAGTKLTTTVQQLAQRLEALETENANLRMESQAAWLDGTFKRYPIFQDAEVGDDAQAALLLKLQALPAGTPLEEAEKVARDTASRFSRIRAGGTQQEQVSDANDGQAPVPPAGGGAAAAALKTDSQRPKNMRDARGLAARLGAAFFASRGAAR